MLKNVSKEKEFMPVVFSWPEQLEAGNALIEKINRNACHE